MNEKAVSPMTHGFSGKMAGARGFGLARLLPHPRSGRAVSRTLADHEPFPRYSLGALRLSNPVVLYGRGERI
ncbi:MAG: hypothetical protein HY887_09490 [Deltaproteobacteria bacterium]|nr:hypothetical protein [Deltaproteobacteria bacterium]